MYYIVYGLLYLFSLLPFFILYGISNIVAFMLHRIFKYRKDSITQNLTIAFPDKTEVEKKELIRKFYRNFTDNFIETIKVLSISAKEFDKRNVIDMQACNGLAAAGKNIQFNSGHQMNWEYANLAISKNLKLPWLAVYKKIGSKPVEKLFLKLRSRFGATMVAIEDYTHRMPSLMKHQYALGLIADQNPAMPHNSYWLNFFSKATPFLTGTDKGARRNKTAVVFVDIIRVKRGYYKIDLHIISDDGSEFADGELTRKYRTFLEKSINKQPDNYLWSHRRWKHDYKNEFRRKWIDLVPPPKGIDEYVQK